MSLHFVLVFQMLQMKRHVKIAAIYCFEYESSPSKRRDQSFLLLLIFPGILKLRLEALLGDLEFTGLGTVHVSN